MTENSEPVQDQRARNVTLWGLALNIFLMILKIVSGILVGSSALVADGVHSFSDLFTDVAVLVGLRLSSKPADASHPYGHKRFETLIAQMIAVVLFAVALGFIYSAVRAISNHENRFPGIVVLVVAGLSVITKEWIFVRTRKISREMGCAALYANAWHHRSDSFSSVAVLLGGAVGLLGWGHADQVATIVVGIMILGVAVKIFYEGLVELTEHAVDQNSIREIETVLSEAKDISDWHKLRTRRVGGELFVDVHILVDPDMTVSRSHAISDRIEKTIRQRLTKPLNILVHVDPSS